MNTQFLILTVAAVAIIALLMWQWFRSHTLKKAAHMAQQVFPVWGAQGPFESGEQSAAAMRYAWLAVRGLKETEEVAEMFAKHADSYDSDPAKWEKTRQEAVRTAGPETDEFVTIAEGFAAMDSLNKDFLEENGHKLELAREPEGYEELLNKSVGIVKSYTDNDSSVIGSLARNEKHLRSWIDYITPNLIDISDAASKREQILNLREKTVKMIEASYRYKPLLHDERNEYEKELIAKTLFEGRNFEEALTLSAQTYMFAEASIACYRSFSMELGDASKNDWFSMYCDCYEGYITILYDHVIAIEKDGFDSFEATVPMIKQGVDEIREKVLQGHQLDYDREKIKPENEKEERRRKAEEEAKEPIIAKIVSKHQIDELSDFLCERYIKFLNGDLYKLDSYSQADFDNAFFLDTGLMLIALSECVIDFDTAKQSLKKIIFLAFAKLDKSDYLPASESEVPIHMQMEIYSIKADKEVESWLFSICLVTACLMYEIDYETLTEEEQRTLGGDLLSFFGDAWCCYATTMNVFGHDMNANGLSSE